MGKLEHGHNDTLPEGRKEVGPNVINHIEDGKDPRQCFYLWVSIVKIRG